jgi:hypothetical protein
MNRGESDLSTEWANGESADNVNAAARFCRFLDSGGNRVVYDGQQKKRAFAGREVVLIPGH